MNSRHKLLLGTCFFLSGATSLVLEVAWSKELSYILGNTLYAVATVVAAFMAGLGLGSALASVAGERIKQPVRAYAFMQFAIAACGAVSIPLFRATQPLFGLLYQAMEPGQGIALAMRFLGVFVLMMVPVTLMGMTLPVVVGAYARRREAYALEAGVLYGVNTLGAVAGTLGAGFLLIPALGLAGTCVAAAAADVLTGCVAWRLNTRVGAIEDIRGAEGRRKAGAPPALSTRRRGIRWTGRQRLVGILFGVSGAAALACEVGWFRLLGLTIGPSVYAFAAMLGCFLLGVGAGSAAAARWAQKTRLTGIRGMALLEGLLGAAVLGGLYYFNRVPEWNFWVYQWASGWSAEWGFGLSHVVIAALVVGAPCLAMGALFPVAVRAVKEAGEGREAPEANVGKLYVLNTAGGIVGSLAAGFWLVPSVGAWKVLAGAGVVNAALGSALWLLASGRSSWRRAAEACAAVALAALFAGAAPPWNAAMFNQGYYREIYTEGKMDLGRLKNQKLVFYREGINSPVAVFNIGGDASLRVTGKADASTNATDLYTQLFVGHLPVMFAQDPRRVAVIGYGSGMSAMAVLTHPLVESLDVIEIERAVIDASPYFESVNGRPLADPRAHLILEDGRTYFTYTKKTYDVIASEPSNPWMAGVANLFTVDFYRTVRERLSAGGIFGQWIQTYEISPETFRVILASVREVFPHIVVFYSGPGDIVVLASGEPIRIPWQDFEARFRSQRVRASFERLAIQRPIHLTYYMQGSEDVVNELLRGVTARNTDDNVWLEHRMPRDMVGVRPTSSTSGDNVSHLVASLGAARHLRALQDMLPGIPLEACVQGILEYVLGIEPTILPGGAVPDSWLPMRTVRIGGMRQEIEGMGDPDLLRGFDAYRREQERYFENRREAARLLAVPLGRGEAPNKATVERALALAPDLPQPLLLTGNSLYVQGRLDEAERYYRRLLEYPMSAAGYDALVGLGNIAALRRRFDEAAVLLERAVARNPYFPNAYANLATLYLGQNDPERAREALVRGLQFNPSHPDLEAKLRSLTSPS